MKNAIFLLLLLALVVSCKKDDPCDGVTCENNGSCVDGSCACIGLWRGEKCTEQITPLLISIRQMTNTKFPATDNNGAGWDLTSGPDIYFIMKQSGTTILSSQDNFIQNASVGASWTFNLSIVFPKEPITIEMWDYDDFDSDDFMGAVTGVVYTDTNGFPTLINLDCGICPVAFSLSNISYL